MPASEAGVSSLPKPGSSEDSGTNHSPSFHSIFPTITFVADQEPDKLFSIFTHIGENSAFETRGPYCRFCCGYVEEMSVKRAQVFFDEVSAGSIGLSISIRIVTPSVTREAFLQSYRSVSALMRMIPPVGIQSVFWKRGPSISPLSAHGE